MSRHIPVPVVGLTGVKSLALGGGDDNGFTCAVHEDGGVSCWGRNALKMLGTTSDELCGPDSTPCSTKPLRVPDLANVVSVSASVQNACALHEDGKMSCWGLYSEVKKLDAPVGILEIAVGALHTCARTANEVLCWGGNTSGQCGQDMNTQLSVNSPTPVTGLGAAKRIAASYYHTCAITAADEVRCWGSNQCGQLGNATYCGTTCGTMLTTCGEWKPTTVAASDLLEPLNPPPREIGVGAYHTCVSSDRIFCWGRNDFGQVGLTAGGVLGNGEPFVPQPVPTSVLHTLSLTVGPYHACALIDGGGVRCMGRNDYGQLGNGTTDSGPSVGVLWQLAR